MNYKNNNNLPLVVIFGRANVGKSTLFNTLIEKKQALVTDIPGTTRDSNLGIVEWQRQKFNLVDTGGILDIKCLTSKSSKTDDIETKVQLQARQYLAQADLILFLIDNKSGLLLQDKQLALFLKKTTNQKNILLVANKVDNPNQQFKTAEFFKLGLGQPQAISASSGSGTGDLLDIITNKFSLTKLSNKIDDDDKEEVENEDEDNNNNDEDEEKNKEEKKKDLIKICIIGKPNVGKSSLLNSILGYERVIVSPIPHTTREPQDTEISYQGKLIKLIDTAGISKRGTKTKGLEKYGIEKSLGILGKADIALLVLDINEEITRQDAKIVAEILDRRKSLIFIANKWDKIEERDSEKYIDYIYTNLPFAQFVPIQFTSALTGEKVQKVLDVILQIAEERKLLLSDSQLDKFLARIVKIHKPAKGKGVKHPRIYELTQISANPPKFELRIGIKDNLHFSYVRFIENRLREKFGFSGTPISIKINKGREMK
ncbi:MAG: ribosome biogenesis GTPase Der [Patescibacteria group bacterium]|nr:ribosome biogenesis GTPase Der [Patescibacteria group bacterium]MBU2081652.1 ribosome biogenesis GTPase Der [Patescibacteria group bacterium]MBU2214718.1 ribosome biogenesis GTPase Der [Patescibacteria group bacterium]MBU2250360.1 ribosome biogenesis GTPase Der [Patescibacteria group bacterium]